MAAPLKMQKLAHQPRHLGLARWLLAALAVLPFTAAGEALNDPLRPPAAVYVKPGEAGAAGAADAQRGLQSILVSGTRREAIINGKIVRVGDRVEGAKVVRILEDSVVLRDGKGEQVLKLYPGIEKRLARPETRPEARREAGKAAGSRTITDKTNK